MSTPRLDPMAMLDTLLELVADRVADQITTRLSSAQNVSDRAEPPLLSLDELVAELPPAKRPETWKGWLYERLPRGDVPGAVKLGGRWFFRAAEVRAWIQDGAP